MGRSFVNSLNSSFSKPRSEPIASDRVIEQTLLYLKTLLPPSEADFQPKTALGKKLWEIRQRSIAEGTKLLTEPELQQELADRFGAL